MLKEMLAGHWSEQMLEMLTGGCRGIFQLWLLLEKGECRGIFPLWMLLWGEDGYRGIFPLWMLWGKG